MITTGKIYISPVLSFYIDVYFFFSENSPSLCFGFVPLSCFGFTFNARAVMFTLTHLYPVPFNAN